MAVTVVSPARELVFIDSRAPQLDLLAAAALPGRFVIVLPPDLDAVTRIADAVAGHSSLDAIHLIGHGAPGSLQLGAGTLDRATIAARGDDFRRIGAALSADGAVQLYACEAAAGDEGAALLDALSKALGGVAVAGSTGLVGAGGGWSLDAGAGWDVPPFAAEALAAYAGTLARVNTAPTITLPGRSDLVVLDAYHGSVRVADGATGLVSEVGALDALSSFALGDINGDGVTDIVAGSRNSGFVKTYLGDGAGGFSAGSSYFVSGPATVLLADFNRDGSLDIVAMNGAPGAISTLKNDGAGGFSLTHQYNIGTGFTSGAVGDLDGDGDPDILAIYQNQTGGTRASFINTGAGGFTNPSGGSTAGTNWVDVALGDVDKDGDLDALLVDQLGGRAYQYRGTGSGIISAGTPISVGTAPTGAAYGDIDNDGDLDALVSMSTGVTVLRNTGSGSYTVSIGEIAFLGGASSVTLEDYDGDGLLDAFVTSQSAGGVVAFQNNGGVFAFRTIYTIPGANPVEVKIDDLNPSVSTDAGEAVVFSSQDGNLIKVADKDGGALTVTLFVEHGTLKLATTGGLVMVEGDGGEHAILIFTGTQAQIAAALDGLTYQPEQGFSGVDRIDVTVVDAGGDLNGVNPAEAHKSMPITVKAPPLPVIDLDADDSASVAGTFQATHVEGGASTGIVDADVSITTSLDALTSATVTLTNHHSGDLLEVSGALPDGITAAQYDAGTGVLTLSGTASLADYQTALKQIAFRTTSDDPVTSDRTITITAVNGSHESLPATAVIHVTGVNDAPILNGLPAGEDFVEGGPAADLFSFVGVSTVEDGQLVTGATVTVGGLHDGDAEVLSIDGTDVALGAASSGVTASNGIAYSVTLQNGTATVTLSSVAGVPAAAMSVIIDALGYRNASENPTAGQRTVTVSGLTDSGGAQTGSGSLVATVDVEGVNDDPVASDDVLAIIQRLSASGNLLTGGVADKDPEGDTLTVSHLDVYPLPGLDSSVTVKGTYGSLTVGTDGGYTYVADREDKLAVGEVATDSFAYTVDDGHDGEDTATLTVTVTGSALGNAGANTFRLTGPGTVATGLGGNDTYIVDSQVDQVIEARNGGTDTVRTSVSYTLAAGQHIERLVTADASGAAAIDLTGNAYDNALVGNAGANTLNGGRGDDTMTGLGGADRYVVTSGDTVVEDAGGGVDTVFATEDFALSDNVENIRAYGAAADLGIRLTGNDGENLITGGAGLDTLTGLGGDDRYIVTTGDKVVEAEGGGVDTVFATADFKLSDHIETLRAYGPEGDLGLKLTGNGGANQIYGGAGADTLRGGDGADRFYVGAGDTVIEEAGQGTDIVYASTDFTLGANVEHLTATSGAGLRLTGNDEANKIVGGAGDDVITGGLGIDRLYGMAGRDSFVFNTLAEGTATRYDRIQDFVSGADRINLSAIQAKTGAAIDQAFDFIGDAAFSKAAGQLRYGLAGADTLVEGDVNGDGRTDFRVLLIGDHTLTATDFIF